MRFPIIFGCNNSLTKMLNDIHEKTFTHSLSHTAPWKMFTLIKKHATEQQN